MGQDASLEKAYEFLCDVRDTPPLNLNARLAAAGFDDIPEHGLLILSALGLKAAAARLLIRRLGIDGPAASQSVEKLIVRGYLDLQDNPDDPRQPVIAFTERGRAALHEAAQGHNADRWAQFPLRPGDIIISTMPKSGTTWMQMICALLIFQTPALPAPLPDLSPFLTEYNRSRREIYAELAAQQHRRFIKTHMPLNEIPADPQVTYIVVVRNPLDTAVSIHYHTSVLMTAPDQRAPSGGERQPETAHQWLLTCIDEMAGGGGGYFDTLLDSACRAWERRNEPNVVLIHYEDLSADLPGEMRQLASRLDISVPEDKWPSLIQAATFKQMQAAADQLQPLQREPERDVSKGHSAFFRKGSSGDGRALLTESEAARYYTRAARIAPPELLTWLHRDERRRWSLGSQHDESALP
jgi:aryl sulfotransferase